MSNEERLAVKDVNLINDETLELLRRRIESDVKRNFWLSIGGPVGAGGIVAFLLAIFVWLPGSVDDLIHIDRFFVIFVIFRVEIFRFVVLLVHSGPPMGPVSAL